MKRRMGYDGIAAGVSGADCPAWIWGQAGLIVLETGDPDRGLQMGNSQAADRIFRVS